MQTEAEGIVALYGNFFNKFTQQFRVGVVEEVRPILQQGYQLPRPMGGVIAPKKEIMYGWLKETRLTPFPSNSVSKEITR